MPIKMICVWLLGLLLTCHGVTAYAQYNGEPADFDEVGMEDLYGDEELVSIATGSSKPIYKAPAVASVITAREIERMGARNLNDVLETVPGLHIMPSPIDRLNPTFAIRGINSSFNPQVLMLINGIPFKKNDNGGRPTLFRLPVSSISRVEVIRGPGSAVYGADAFSGVINIITKDAGDIDGTEVGGRGGSFNSKDFWLQHGDTWGGLDVALTFEWQKSDGDDKRRLNEDAAPTISLAPGPLETRYEVFDTHLELKKADWKLRLWNWRLVDAGVGAGGALALDPVGSEDTNLYLADLTYSNDHLAQNWDFSANLHYKYYKSDSYFILYPPGNLGLPDGMIGNPWITRQDLGFDVAAVYEGMRSHSWRVGAGFMYEEIDTGEINNFQPATFGILTDVSNTDAVTMSDALRRLWYLSLQDEWQLAPDWELTAGVRFDEYSDFGGTLNPRLALVWATRYNLTSKLLYGRAFRAPTLAELSNKTIVVGNSELDPETIDTFELAFDYRPTFDWQLNLSIFFYQAKDLITFANRVATTNDQNGYGFELEAKWDVNDKLDLGGNFALQHSEDVDTEERIANVPSYQQTLFADWKFLPNWNLHPQINWVGGYKREETDTRPELDDYLIVDLTVSRKQIAEHWDFTLAARNLFDEDAKEPSDGVNLLEDFPLEGRSLWAELSYRF